MADVVEIAAGAARGVLRKAAVLAPTHPALRWLGLDGAAHRRCITTGLAYCGAPLQAEAAANSVARCEDCS